MKSIKHLLLSGMLVATATAAAPSVHAQAITGTPGAPSSTVVIDGKQLPPPPLPFKGVIKEEAPNSKPYWPPRVVPPKGAPNVLLIMTDDQGYGVSGTFGGVIPTPATDRIAKAGLRYTQFHSTALCSPTRAALITGRNHHSVGFGVIGEMSTGFPGYDSVIGQDSATIGKILQDNGYATSWFGKNHNTPTYQYGPSGPFDQWPSGMGFQYFYGFMGGETDQWTPYLFCDHTQIYPWVGRKDYNLITDMADEAIKYMGDLNAAAPDQPFFLYYVPGGTHSPHQPKAEWRDKFKGQFDMGWEKLREQIFANQKRLGVIPADTQLTPWPDGQAGYAGAKLPRWDSLSLLQKKLYARQAENFAGYAAYTDNEIGRVIQAVEDMGKLDNTLIIYISGDNGTSAEGTLEGTFNQMTAYNGILTLPEPLQLLHYENWGSDKTYPHMSVAWTWAFDTPFKWTKQKPVEGMSMAYTFDPASAGPKSPSKRNTQYFEMFGNRGIYHNGWYACTTPPEPVWLLGAKPLPPMGEYKWELYNVAEDYSQANDLSAKNPDQLKELQAGFQTEAQKYQILPLDNSLLPRLVTPRPSAIAGQDVLTYTGVKAGIPTGNAPSILDKDYTITAEITVPEGGAEGMIVTFGGRFGGYGMFLQGGKPVFVYNLLDLERFRWEGGVGGIVGQDLFGSALKAGKHTLAFDFKYDGPGKGGTGVFTVDGRDLAKKTIPHTIPILMSIDETLDVGLDTRTGVDDSYELPFKFTGTINKVTYKLGPSQMTPAQQKAGAEAVKKATD